MTVTDYDAAYQKRLAQLAKFLDLEELDGTTGEERLKAAQWYLLTAMEWVMRQVSQGSVIPAFNPNDLLTGGRYCELLALDVRLKNLDEARQYFSGLSSVRVRQSEKEKEKVKVEV